MKQFLLFFLLPFCIVFAQGQPVSVTFKVDMSAEIVSSSGVHIAGNFQSVAGLGDNWNPGSTLVTDVNGDDIYEITVSIPPGTYEYKFINGNAWGMDENPPSDCAVGSTNNRQVVVGNSDLELPPVPFNACIELLRFSVNMSGQSISPNGVHVMGDFQAAAGLAQNWDPNSLPMEDLNGDGTYEVAVIVPPGTYQYLFVNGNSTMEAESLPTDCTVLGENGSRNRAYTFTPGAAAPTTYCFNTCQTCHPAVVFEYETEWWNDAVFYEIFVRSFYDSNGDGIGDFQGLTEKLDYLNDGNPDTHDDLGITGIWLMPMMASPSYHGYDVTNYYATEPDYGTMADFEAFLDAAHARGIKVIIDLVMNHSSNQHPWFSQSASNTGGYRDWFIWSDNNPGNQGPWGQNVWHFNGGDYYYGLFWSGMPDLNYTHPPVKEEMFNVVDFWLDKGVDGYRLDAIKYLIEEGLQLENTEGTFSLLEAFHERYKSNNPAAFTVGEVWSNTASVIPYVQNDRLDVCFEFDLASAILNTVNNTNVGNLEQQLQKVLESYPALQYATFLTNHDIDRVFSTLNADIAKMKLAASLYLTLPGIPFIYYGEEVGMTGTGDHLNIRRPMQWSSGTHGGFSTVNPWQGLGSNYQNNNVEVMNVNPYSLLSHYRQLIQIRNEQAALRRGITLFVENTNEVASFARVYEDEAVVVVANPMTQAAQPVLSLPRSPLPAGEYFVTELMSSQAFGTINVDVNGGFSNWQYSGTSLSGQNTWVLLLSTDNPLSNKNLATAAPLFRLGPNPASSHFQIFSSNKQVEIAAIRVFSITGQVVYENVKSSPLERVNTEHWTPGLYFVQVISGSGNQVLPLVVF
ncbi:MAG TPA: alpha-amylase family glycosyl hydrolase [Saprospiraceae bacterium]|nr:alpha-amylase family glycosyl hydrolase [Saprospiraceae bacterium]HMQ82686.1 alpha-amylase family glycosyl hydrolase [Saprospiraceae bacterium]